MSFNNSHFLKASPVGTLAASMAQPQPINLVFVDTEMAESDEAWKSCVDEIGKRVGMDPANLIVYRAQPAAQDKQASDRAC